MDIFEAHNTRKSIRRSAPISKRINKKKWNHKRVPWLQESTFFCAKKKSTYLCCHCSGVQITFLFQYICDDRKKVASFMRNELYFYLSFHTNEKTFGNLFTACGIAVCCCLFSRLFTTGELNFGKFFSSHSIRKPFHYTTVVFGNAQIEYNAKHNTFDFIYFWFDVKWRFEV